MRKPKLISALLVFMVMLVACEDKNDDFVTPNNEKYSSESMIIDFNTTQIICDVSIDSLHPYVVNNFVSRIGFPLEGGEFTIFKGEITDEFGYIFPLNPIVEFVKDEFSIKKIIASWSKDTIRILTDSIYQNITKFDSCYHEKLNYYDYSGVDSTIIYVNLLNINRYGSAKLKINDPKIYTFLQYDINTVTQESNIDITPQEFRNKYGDAFCSSLVLGTFNFYEGAVYGVSNISGSRNEALKEAVDMVKLFLSEEKDWNELVKDSKYLKNSYYFDSNSKRTMGYSGTFFGSYNAVNNSADSLFKLGKFNNYSSGYKLYSELYPNFDFTDVVFPY